VDGATGRSGTEKRCKRHRCTPRRPCTRWNPRKRRRSAFAPHTFSRRRPRPSSRSQGPGTKCQRCRSSARGQPVRSAGRYPRCTRAPAPRRNRPRRCRLRRLGAGPRRRRSGNEGRPGRGGPYRSSGPPLAAGRRSGWCCRMHRPGRPRIGKTPDSCPPRDYAWNIRRNRGPRSSRFCSTCFDTACPRHTRSHQRGCQAWPHRPPAGCRSSASRSLLLGTLSHRRRSRSGLPAKGDGNDDWIWSDLGADAQVAVQGRSGRGAFGRCGCATGER
jgi:hypothetical protein